MKSRRVAPALFTLSTIAALLLLALPAATVQPPQARTTISGGHEAVANEVLVKFRGAPDRADVARDTDAESDEDVGGIGVRLIHSRSLQTDALLAALARRPDIEYLEPNYILHAAATVPTDPQWGQLWGLLNNGQSILGVAGTPSADIDAILAWDISTGSRANVVTVVDTGIDYTHPDLAANVWSAPSAFSVTVGGRVVNCAIGTHGYNAITGACDPRDDNDHGTHVSGTIGAQGDNGVGVVGVNWTASVMGSKFLDATGSGSLANAINAIEFAVQAKSVLGTGANVRVLSNSWGGGGFSQSLLDEINRANASNMLFVAAAGNNGSNNDTTAFYPADYAAPNVVAVAATDNKDALASFSNYGHTTVALGAPGVSILSTIRNSSYAYFSGTSMATPHVSGAAALVLSACTLDTAGLKSAILAGVDPISSLATRTSTGGRLNVFKALATCSTPAPAPDFSLSATPSSQTTPAGGSVSYTVSVTASNGFSGSVALSASGLPAGASATFNPIPVTGSGSSTLTVTTSASTPVGTYTVQVTGTSGSLTHSATVSLSVTSVASPDFTLSVSPTSLRVRRGSTGHYTITVGSTGGFSGTVALSVSGVPLGTTDTFSTTSVSVPAGGSAQATVTMRPGSNAVRGTYTLTFTGTSSTRTHSQTVSFTIR